MKLSFLSALGIILSYCTIATGQVVSPPNQSLCIDDLTICMDMQQQVNHRPGPDNNEWIVDRLPNNVISFYYRDQGGNSNGEGYLLAKVTKTYELKINGNLRDKVKAIRNRGFYKKIPPIIGIFRRNSERQEENFSRTSYNNLVGDTLGGIHRINRFFGFYWAKHNDTYLLRESLRHFFEFRRSSDPDYQTYTIFLIHYRYGNPAQFIHTGRFSDHENSNNLEEVFIEINSFRGLSHHEDKFVTFKEAN